METKRYGLQERPRLGVWEVIDVDDPEAEPLFVGLKDDCREWIEFPELRDTGKPDDYPFHAR